MKIVLTRIILLSLFLVAAHPCQAEDFDRGFRGIAWGTPKKDLPDIGLSEKSAENIYAKGDSAIMFMEGLGKLEMRFGEVPLTAIYLRFKDAIFCGVDLIFDRQRKADVQRTLTDVMKQEGRLKAESLIWQNERIAVELTDREVLIVAKQN